VECYDRYVSEARRTNSDLQRRKDGASGLQDKSIMCARLLALAPDLLGSCESSLELGIVRPCLYVKVREDGSCLQCRLGVRKSIQSVES